MVTKRPQARLNSENLQLERWSLWCDGIRDTSNILVQISFFSLKTIITFSLTLHLTLTLHPRRTLVRKLNVVSRKNDTNLEALAGFVQDERD